MTHWGWYWKIKRKHEPKALCNSWHFSEIDSFRMFKNKELIQLIKESSNRTSFEIPSYNLKATLLDNDSLNVTYNNGSYIIPVEKKPCNYGGYYYFFHCPKCKIRMRKLYCMQGEYLCRKCLNLGYLTQRLRTSNRHLIMANKIKMILENKSGSLDRKPPWMKKKTFKNLKDKHFEYYEIKFGMALRNELMTYYPKHSELI